MLPPGTISRAGILPALLPFLLMACNSGNADQTPGPKTMPRPQISASVLEDKIYASWLGQMVGNIYGLVHENKYVDEPGPDDLPYGYDYAKTGIGGGGFMTEIMKQYGGSFSDDDTDFEYLYLMQMEKHGPEPTYAQLRDAWMYHVRDYVWIANRAALTLMHAGYYPPTTGQKAHNHEWFQIDPQLINEIWATTAPGMIDYATAKSAWAARITNDDWGIEPTVHYGAMYAAAFFESDVGKLIDIGTAALPKDSVFGRTVEHVKQLYSRFPGDWKAARKELAKTYHKSNDGTGTGTWVGREDASIWNANLNGACAILALLYGQGDFQTTLDLACAIGFDCDNQAATMCGLLGIIHGVDGIPRGLLFPIDGWSEPFNNRYINRTRHDMPDASIRDMARRTLAQAEKIILQQGGSREGVGGEAIYTINPAAKFTAPLELNPEPLWSAGISQPCDHTFYAGGADTTWRVTSGRIPPGLALADGRLFGTPTAPGHYHFEIEVADNGQTRAQHFEALIVAGNLAPTANEILVHPRNEDQSKEHLEWLRDGHAMHGGVYRSFKNPKTVREDFYGYRWNDPVEIGVLCFTTGNVDDRGGWFTDWWVEYVNEAGAWTEATHLQTDPPLVIENSRFHQGNFITRILRFDAVKTRGVRIVGIPGGGKHPYKKTEPDMFYSSVCELSVHAAIED